MFHIQYDIVGLKGLSFIGIQDDLSFNFFHPVCTKIASLSQFIATSFEFSQPKKLLLKKFRSRLNEAASKKHR